MALGQKILQLEPLNEGSYFNLMWAYAAQRRIPEFLELIARAKERDPIRDSVLLRDNESLAHVFVGDYSSAIVAKYETLKIDPHEYQNRTSIAQYYLNAGMPDEEQSPLRRMTAL
jgi:tetratricopeptide (TPR) repeat protein